MGKILTNAKVLDLEETIRKAVTLGNIEEKMDLIILQAADANLSNDDLANLISEIKKQVAQTNTITSILATRKNVISFIVLGIIILEWIIFFCSDSKGLHGIIWTLAINIFSAFIITIVVAWLIQKRNNGN